MPHLIAVDWGTSSLRGARLDEAGRVLEETFARCADLPEVREETLEASTGTYRQGLLRTHVGATTYLDHGLAEG